MRWLLIGTTFAFMTLFLLFPLVCVFYEAASDGLAAFWNAISNKDSLNAVKMTLIATCIAVPLNILFGLAAAWCIGKFQFWGKGMLITYRFYIEATYNGPSVVTHTGTVTYGAPAGDVPVETSYIEASEDRKDMITDVKARLVL